MVHVTRPRRWGVYSVDAGHVSPGGLTQAVSLVTAPADGGRTFRTFIDVPYRLHRAQPCFVPPLRRERLDLFDKARHPFFSHAEAAFFIAVRDGRPVGRI